MATNRRLRLLVRSLTAGGPRPQPSAELHARPHAVPTVDLSAWVGSDDGGSGSTGDGGSRQQQAVVDAVHSAAEDVGFFVVVGHGVPNRLRERVFAAAAAFFASPESAKQSATPASSTDAFGYHARGTLHNSSAREDFAMGPLSPPPTDGLSEREREVVDYCYQPTPWPSPQAHGTELRAAFEEYFEEMANVAATLLCIIARALGLRPELAQWLAAQMSHHHSAMAAIHYPPLVDSNGGYLFGEAMSSWRTNPHCDRGALTILTETSAGLQVWPKGAAEWLDVVCPPGGLICNIGDLLGRWTNDRYTSTMHRVPCPAVDDPRARERRLSLPFFLNMNWDTDVRCLLDGEEPLYAPTSQGEYYMHHMKQELLLNPTQSVADL